MSVRTFPLAWRRIYLDAHKAVVGPRCLLYTPDKQLTRCRRLDGESQPGARSARIALEWLVIGLVFTFKRLFNFQGCQTAAVNPGAFRESTQPSRPELPPKSFREFM
jgi:hypothetical protein